MAQKPKEQKHKLKRKGRALEMEDGSVVLVNEEEQGFKVDMVVAAIWYMCEGREEEEVCKEVASKSGMELEEVKPLVTAVVSKLKENKLVE
jgi:hypothetical protein